MVQSPQEEKLAIHLGDIIQIIAPNNKTIDQKHFFVEYLDTEIIILIEEGTGRREKLYINDGNLRDESITNIILLSRADELGYAQQNGLNKNTWIDIYFGGDLPTTITGQITNLEEDMIEIKLWPSNDVIYIDFAYQGIPPELLIEKITTNRSPPSAKEPILGTVETNLDAEETMLGTTPIGLPTDDSSDNSVSPNRQNLNDDLIDADQFEFGEMLQERHQLVEVSESERRFSMENQTEDMLNYILARIPNSQRTTTVMNKIQILIERYSQLRNIHSKFDEYGSANKPDKKGPLFKPLVNSLMKFDQKLYWILPVVQNKKKIYDLEFNDEDATDIQKETLANNRINVTNLYENYLHNDITEGTNKYVSLFKSLNSYLTPFANPTPNNQTLAEIAVSNNIAAIIDNHEDMNSSVWSNKNLTSDRFFMQNYNVGLTHLIKNQVLPPLTVFAPSPITHNDVLFVKSILTLPEIIIQFSKINLPETNIMTKSVLQDNFVNYWQFLNTRTNVSTVLIDNINKADDNTDNTNLDMINNYVLDERINDDDRYNKYLNKIIPKTLTLFKRIHKYIKGGLSLNKIIGYMEPFLVYHNDLSYQQYVEMVDFIERKISSYKKNYIIKSRGFQLLAYVKKHSSPVPILIELLKDHEGIKQHITQAYNINSGMTDTEILSRITNTDCGQLFTSALISLNEGLVVSGKFEEILHLNESLTSIKKTQPTDLKDNCTQFVLAKKYIAIDELEEDNNKNISFDKHYDKTYYDIVDEYSQQQNMMSPDEFVLFLTEQLKNNNGLSQNNAVRDAEAMIEGKRKVLEGDYAVLEIDGEDDMYIHHYYIRTNNQWHRADTISDDVFTDENKVFCNLQKECYSTDDICASLDHTKLNDNISTVKTMLNEFDNEYSKSQAEMNKNIAKIFTYDLQNILRIKYVKNLRQLKYNNIHLHLGSSEEEEDIIKSPYLKLRDIILQQSDFIKKQSDVLRFCEKFTRAATQQEADAAPPNAYWLYCNTVNVKLIPTFIQRLAICFTLNNNYIDELAQICKEQGEISDDGDSWVDKYSGYVIKKRDFDTEEGFTADGFKDTSRGFLEKDIGSIVLQKQTKKFDDPNTQTISNIISSLSQYMGINIESQREFIINSTLYALKTTLPTEQDYKLQETAADKKGKKALMSYSNLYNSSLIYITAAFYLIGIQINIPSIKTRKTFPNCIRSFEGFPLTGDADKSGITYVACVMHKLKKSSDPWNSIKKASQKAIVRRIENIITSYIVNDNNMRELMATKLLYLSSDNSEIIPDIHKISGWLSFLPPLVEITMKTVHNISTEFKESLVNNIKKGVKLQNEQFNVINGKIMYFSFTIQIMISNIVKNKAAVLTNSVEEPFLENACCNERQGKTYAYFNHLDPHIGTTNVKVLALSKFIGDLRKSAMAPFFLDLSDTKPIYPTLSDNFSESTIYKVFIVLCNYKNSLPIPTNLQPLCINKPDNLKSIKGIKDQISHLKQEGFNFSESSFMQLLDIINKQNIVHIATTQTEPNIIQKLRDVTTQLKDTPNAWVPSTFVEQLSDVLDTFDISTPTEPVAVRTMKNTLARENKNMVNNLISFIKQHSKLGKKGLSVLKEKIDNVFDFESVGDEIMYQKDTETTFRGANFIRNAIEYITQVFPNIIKNKVDFKNVSLPQHWKLSQIHNNDIIMKIKEYYAPLSKFYNDAQMTALCVNIQEKSKLINILSQLTPFLSNTYKNNVVSHSILDARMIKLLYEFYLLLLLNNIITLSSDPLLVLITNDSSDTEEKVEEEENEDYNISQLEIVRGEIKGLSKNIASVVLVVLKQVFDNKKSINHNKDAIMGRVLRSKEKEKEQFTDSLENKTDEERNIDTIFKNHKLERWGVGLQKGLTQYNPKTYDQERAALEQQALMDIKLGKNTFVTDMNREIYTLDVNMDDRNAQEIEDEVNDISYIPDDDDNDEDNDGYLHVA